MKNENGITLISLVVTIIVMLILTTVSIGTVKTGLIDKAKNAQAKAEQSIVEEKINIAISECEFEYFESNNDEMLKYLYENLGKHLDEFKNVNMTLNSENILLNFEYNQKEYSFNISEKGIIAEGKQLTGSVKIGDFIKYAFSYSDSISGKEYNESNGWVVIDDGVTGNTSGMVRIMSYGIPAKWKYTGTSDEIDEIIDNFLNINLVSFDGEKQQGKDYFVENVASHISVATLEDLNNAYNILYNDNRKIDDYDSYISNGNDMFCNQLSSLYWILNGKELYRVLDKSVLKEEYSSPIGVRCGLKIVVTLKSDLKGKLTDNVWEISNI